MATMKVWQADTVITAPIEAVWDVIDGSEDHLKALDPHIVSHIIINETPERIGSKYQQTYREGTKDMTYIVEVIDYDESPTKKRFTIGFNLGGMFDITAGYQLIALDPNTTHLTYRTTNQPLKFFAKIMMKLMKNDSVVKQHLQRISHLATHEHA